MKILREHWYKLGAIFAIIIIISLAISYHQLSNYSLLMWLSMVSLFVHQLEEYYYPGTFPGMVNRQMFHSKLPDRFPLNSNTSLLINVFIGWSIYLSAAVFGTKLLWLGIASILISLGNILAHTLLFNIKGKTFYNAGMASALLLFIPCVYFFFNLIFKEHLYSIEDFLIGVPLGIAINYFGILKLITWLADKNTTYVFRKNQC